MRHLSGHIHFVQDQWRIQDFPDGGAPTPNWDYFANFLPKTAWKWKNLDPLGRWVARPWRPPLRSANEDIPLEYLQQTLKFENIWSSIDRACWRMVHGDCYVTIIVYLHRTPAYPSPWNSACYIMTTRHGNTFASHRYGLGLTPGPHVGCTENAWWYSCQGFLPPSELLKIVPLGTVS